MDIELVFWLLTMAAVGAVVWLLCSSSRYALAVALCLALFALVWAGFWNWFLRDGLGPGSIPSTGSEALRRFAADMLFPGSICGFIIAFAIVFFSWRRRGTHHVV
jgi:hypothetical protein